MNVVLIYEINNILCLGITMKFRATITKNESAISRVIIRLEVGSLKSNEHMHLKSIAKKQYKQIYLKCCKISLQRVSLSENYDNTGQRLKYREHDLSTSNYYNSSSLKMATVRNWKPLV